jgi:hypothetical protein
VPLHAHTHTHQHTRLTVPLWGVFTLFVPHLHCQCFLNRPLPSFPQYVSDSFLFHTTQSAGGCCLCNFNCDSSSPEMFLACITLRASKLSHACYMPVRLIILYLIFQIMFCGKYKIIKISLSLSLSLGPEYSPSHPPPRPASCLQTPSVCAVHLQSHTCTEVLLILWLFVL